MHYIYFRTPCATPKNGARGWLHGNSVPNYYFQYSMCNRTFLDWRSSIPGL